MDTAIIGDTKELFVYDGSPVLLEEVFSILHFEVSHVQKIARGGNNGIFILENRKQERLLAKFYQRDDRARLDREYHANTFLKNHGFSVPNVLLRNDRYQYGVYSFEEGEPVEASKASQQHIDGLVDFLVQLQTFTPETISDHFPPAVVSMTSAQAVVDDNERRIQAIRSAIESGTAHPLFVEMLKETGFLEDIVQMTDHVLRAGSNPSWNIEAGDQRLSPVDFGFHNALFRDEKPPCILDLEYMGWDDPLHPIADFIVHDQTRGLPQTLQSYFIEAYCERTHLPTKEHARLSELIALNDIKWIAIYLQSLTPKYLDARSFAAGGMFDTEAYIRQQMQKIEQRKMELHQKIFPCKLS